MKTLFSILLLTATISYAQPTQLMVRAKAKDAKLKKPISTRNAHIQPFMPAHAQVPMGHAIRGRQPYRFKINFSRVS